jgi:hypothetical protein
LTERHCPPILLLIFNRPDLTQKVFNRIREARPERFYVAADGPRQNRPGDLELCEEAREVAMEVDWPCEVKTLLRDENLGCGIAVSQATTWFFEQESEGIILEDDCLPHTTFFRFCDELLDRYRDDERVAVISGNNYQKRNRISDASYYFSIYTQTCGWATWRRTWQHFDSELNLWHQLRNTTWLKDLFGDSDVAQFWKSMFDMVHAGRNDIWDIQLTYSCWIQSGLTILPTVNLVTNIGYGERATHSQSPDDPLANLPALAMRFPLKHPIYIMRDFEADRYDSRHVFGIKPYWTRKAHSLLSFGYRRLPERIRHLINPLRMKIGI